MLADIGLRLGGLPADVEPITGDQTSLPMSHFINKRPIRRVRKHTSPQRPRRD
jgi:hypothetical protein